MFAHEEDRRGIDSRPQSDPFSVFGDIGEFTDTPIPKKEAPKNVVGGTLVQSDTKIELDRPVDMQKAYAYREKALVRARKELEKDSDGSSVIETAARMYKTLTARQKEEVLDAISNMLMQDWIEQEKTGNKLPPRVQEMYKIVLDIYTRKAKAA